MLHRHPGLETGRPELAQAAFVATGRQQVGHAGAHRIARIVRPLRRIARLPPPVAVEVGVVGIRREGHRGSQVQAMRGRRAESLRVHLVVPEWVLVRIRLPLGEREPRVRHLRGLVVIARADSDRLLLAQFVHHLQVDVADLEVHVVARAVGFLVRAVRDEASLAEGVAHLAVDLAEVLVAERGDEPAGAVARHRRRDVVDHRADCVRSVSDLPRPLQDLDALEALDRRVVVRRVVAVRGIGDWNAVFEQQHLARTGRVKAADAEVRPQAESFLVAREHSGHFAHRFVDGEDAGLGENVRVDDRSRSPGSSRGGSGRRSR